MAAATASEETDEPDRVRCGSAGGTRKPVWVGVVGPFVEGKGGWVVGPGTLLVKEPKARRGGSVVVLGGEKLAVAGDVILTAISSEDKNGEISNIDIAYSYSCSDNSTTSTKILGAGFPERLRVRVPTVYCST